MDQLKTKYDVAVQAIATLEEAIQNLKKISPISLKTGESQELLENVFHDSLIQRFEYSFDCTWKYLKLYLTQTLGVKPEMIAPKPIFRECLKAHILTEQEVEKALKMVDHRNASTHIYDSATAQEIAKTIPGYYVLLKKMIEKSEPK